MQLHRLAVDIMEYKLQADSHGLLNPSPEHKLWCYSYFARIPDMLANCMKHHVQRLFWLNTHQLRWLARGEEEKKRHPNLQV